VGRYRGLPECLEIIARADKITKVLRSMTRERLYACDPLLERLAQHFKHVPSELRPFIQAAHAVVRPRHLARQ
jgi:hypothetical protein